MSDRSISPRPTTTGRSIAPKAPSSPIAASSARPSSWPISADLGVFAVKTTSPPPAGRRPCPRSPLCHAPAPCSGEAIAGDRESGMSDVGSANEAQVEYWNATAGPVWVENQARLDRQLAPLGLAAQAALAPRAGERLLDVGCGCGETTLALAQAVGASGGVT